jgi:hypothetical protein
VPSNPARIGFGVSAGLAIGAVPGLGSIHGIAIPSSLTFGVPAESADSFLTAPSDRAMAGGAISSILLASPTPRRRSPPPSMPAIVTLSAHPLADFPLAVRVDIRSIRLVVRAPRRPSRASRRRRPRRASSRLRGERGHACRQQGGRPLRRLRLHPQTRNHPLAPPALAVVAGAILENASARR